MTSSTDEPFVPLTPRPAATVMLIRDSSPTVLPSS